MAYSLSYNEDEGWIETKIVGKIDPARAKEFTEACVALAAEKGTLRHLADYREGTMAFSALDLVGLPALVEEVARLRGLNAFTARRAVVARPDDPDFHFYETVFVNRGFSVRVFADVEEAKRWLRGE